MRYTLYYLPNTSGAASPATNAYTPGTSRAAADPSHQPANLDKAQDFQDEHENAVDPNAKDKPVKAKKTKRHLVKRDEDKQALPPR